MTGTQQRESAVDRIRERVEEKAARRAAAREAATVLKVESSDAGWLGGGAPGWKTLHASSTIPSVEARSANRATLVKLRRVTG